jgi:hypothetical protein
MKKKNVVRGILAATLALITALAFTACEQPTDDSGGNPGGTVNPGDTGSKLTVNGLPGSGTYAAYVFSSGTDISTFSAISTAYTSSSYQAVGASPSGNVFNLAGWNGASATAAWTGSGSLPVLLLNSSGSPTGTENPMYRRATVNFTNGNGTASFSGFTAVVQGTDPNPGEDGTLAINNLPQGADYAVGVYNHSGAINDLLEWASVASKIIAVGASASGSMTLYAANTADVFTGTGSYMVALYTATPPITVLYKTGVSFTDGCTEINYEEMTDLLGNGEIPDAKGKLTVNNFPADTSLAVTVHNYGGEITCLTDITAVQTDLAKTLAASVGTVSSSPVSLQKYSSPLSAFDGTGTYLVLFAKTTPPSVWYADQVDFEGGCAELDFSSLGLVSELPLTADPPLPPEKTLAEKLDWLDGNAEDDTVYTLTVKADEELAPRTLEYAGKSGITVQLEGSDGEKIITLSENGSLFTVADGVTLILDNNITLKGKDANNASLVQVNTGGILEMNGGAKITGNSLNYTGGGVFVLGGTFTMNGGEISGNTASAPNYIAQGGGVYMLGNGTFTMNGGEISSNTARLGGGVTIMDGTFIMNDGKISGNTFTTTINTSGATGGGVYTNNGTFTMNGGEISGNILDGRNSVSGGGVFVGSGTFTLNDGKISGNTVTTNATASYAAIGGGVYVNNGTFIMAGGEISDGAKWQPPKFGSVPDWFGYTTGSVTNEK